MRALPRVMLLPTALLALSLVATAALGQCPPASEGSLPQDGRLIRYTLNTKSSNRLPAKALAEVQIPVDLTKKTRYVAESTVIGSDARAEIPTRSSNAEGGAGGTVEFPGPISVKIPVGGLTSKIVQQDGRILLVVGLDTFNGQVNEQGLFLARFEADGQTDTSFGQGGSTRVILFAGNKMGNNSSPSMALSPDGKIVVARSLTDMFPGNIPGHRAAIARFEHDGTLDAGFGNGGMVYTTIANNFEALAIAVQRDEKIMVSGKSGHSGSCIDEPCAQYATLIRYQADGQLDASFGNGGVAQAKLLFDGIPAVASTESSFSSLVIEDNGLVVAAGQVQMGTGVGLSIKPSKMLIAEYLPTGELNPGFGNFGVATLTFDGPYQRFGADSLVLQENGKILIGGTASFFVGDSEFAFVANEAFAIARLTVAGELDGSFGNGGRTMIDLHPLLAASPVLPLDRLSKVVVAASGAIYAAGTASGPLGTSDYAIDLVALNSDGSLRQNFGTNGTYSLGTYMPWRIELADDALLTSNGRLVVSGTHWPSENHPDGSVLWAFSTIPEHGQATCP